jgi:hypothetical protein
MDAVRTLPIRLTPIAGEALDSWLEGLARRTHTAFGELLSAVGLDPYRGKGTSSWIVQLTDEEAERIGLATGVAVEVLESMTLAHYSERGLRIKDGTFGLSRAFPWGRTCGSRFCPSCLKETEGRWQLSWRLGWAFACTKHCCLLADACPECGVVQRRRTHVVDLIPEAAACAHCGTNAIGRSSARCGADLTAAPVTMFGADHPVVHAQRVVDAVIDSETASFGAYRVCPQPRINVLSDLRAVAGRVLAYATPKELQAVVPDDLRAAHFDVARHKVRRTGISGADTKPGLAAPARAAATAVGVIATLHALEKSDIAEAGDELRWLMTSSRARGSHVYPTNTAWGRGISPVLTGIQLAALGPTLNPCDQLRYCIGSALPDHPASSARRASALAHRLPSMLWPVFSLRLSIPNSGQRHQRQALPIALLLVSSRLTLDEAAHLIDAAIEGHAVSRVLQLLKNDDHWSDIRAALVRIAEHLINHRPPIDYRRRARLDYSTLLPDETWAQICRDTGTPGPRVIRGRIARCFLFERLSGRPFGNAPFALNRNEFRGKVVDFPRYFTPELADALDEHARDFLAEHGIGREPPTWHPPTDLLDGLCLPGPNPNVVDLTELHRVMAIERITIGAAAAHLGTDLDTIRFLLENHPAARADSSSETQPANHNAAYRTAKAALSRDRLADLYDIERMSLRDIADAVGVSRQVIARLALDYGIPLRRPGRVARTTIDRAWLYDEYVNKHRTLPDLAKEASMSTANMARLAKTHAIPVRGRGGASHSSTLASQSAINTTPESIQQTERD